MFRSGQWCTVDAQCGWEKMGDDGISTFFFWGFELVCSLLLRVAGFLDLFLGRGSLKKLDCDSL
jgi:hypothetical protein